MANFICVAIVLFSVCCFVILLNLEQLAVATDDHVWGHEQEEVYHHVKVSSLLPQYDCMPSSPKGQKQGATLEVLHRYGPCSKIKYEKTSKKPTHTEHLEMDEARVKFLRSRVNLQPKGQKVVESATTLPATSGVSIGTSNYVVPIGLGTPQKELTVIFDTGSDFTWTQCQPCVRSCYPQVGSIFDPRASSSYANISCSSASCANVISATSATPGCASSTCVYGIQYGDSSFSVGFLASETLTLSSGDVFPNFIFGCGEYNQGLFKGSAGLLGLGRNPLSAVSQTAIKHGKYFSYCLPTKSGRGSLTFGNNGVGSAAAFTQLLTSSQYPSFYFFSLQGISVGGNQLSISPSVFSTAGTIIDSGTVITRLPPAAYTALRSTFKQLMSQYPSASPISILDTCYDFSSYTTVSVPKINLLFSGGAQWNLAIQGILYTSSISQVCLAFAGNSAASQIGILGNTQQQTFNVIYDVAGGKLGFSPGGCS